MTITRGRTTCAVERATCTGDGVSCTMLTDAGELGADGCAEVIPAAAKLKQENNE